MDYELGPHGEKDEWDPCHQVHSRWELRPFSTSGDPRLEGRVWEGEAQSFLLSGRGCCQEEETRKDFLEDACMNDHGKRRRGLPGREKNVDRSQKWRGRAGPLSRESGTIHFDRAPHPEEPGEISL